MKIFQLLLVVALHLVAASCGGNKNSTTSNQTPAPATPATPAPATPGPVINAVQPEHDPVVNDSVIDEGKVPASEKAMPLIISFYSIGMGIDRGQIEKLMAYLEAYEKKTGKKVEYSKVHWGREGETDFCFPFAGSGDKEVADFLKGAKDALNTAEHVHFLQNQECRKPR